MKKILFVVAVMVLMMSTAAFADTVSVTAISGNTVTFSVVNNHASIADVTDAISGFFFSCTGCTGGTAGPNTGTGIAGDVAANGTISGAALATNVGWALTGSGGNYFYSIFNGGTSPQYTIISPNISASCNNSVCGNPAHQPFFITGSGYSSAITFQITFTNIGNIALGQTGTLWYGTAAPTTPPSTTPEPASMLLLGTGLLGVGGAIRRKIRL